MVRALGQPVGGSAIEIQGASREVKESSELVSGEGGMVWVEREGVVRLAMEQEQSWGDGFSRNMPSL